jgi:hypothetical protein
MPDRSPWLYDPRNRPTPVPPPLRDYPDLYRALTEAARVWDENFRRERGEFAELLSLQAAFLDPRSFDLEQLRERARILHHAFHDAADRIGCELIKAHDLATAYIADDQADEDVGE